MSRSIVQLNTRRRSAASALLLLSTVLPAACLQAQQTRCEQSAIEATCVRGGPAEAYFLFRAAVVAATSADDLAPFFATPVRTGLEMLPETEVARLIEHLQDAYPAAMELLDEKLEEGKAVLTLSGMHAGVRHAGTVELLREDGHWRIRHEEWQLRFE